MTAGELEDNSKQDQICITSAEWLSVHSPLLSLSLYSSLAHCITSLFFSVPVCGLSQLLAGPWERMIQTVTFVSDQHSCSVSLSLSLSLSLPLSLYLCPSLSFGLSILILFFVRTLFSGDVMIVPESWGHGVLNLQETVAVATEVKASLWRSRPPSAVLARLPNDNRCDTKGSKSFREYS